MYVLGGGYYPVNTYAPVPGAAARGYTGVPSYQPAVQPQYWTGQQYARPVQPVYTPTGGYYQQYGQQYGQQYYPQTYGQQQYHPGYWTGSTGGYYPKQPVPAPKVPHGHYPVHYPARPVHYPAHPGYYPPAPRRKEGKLAKTLLGAAVVGAVAGAVARG